MGELMVRGGGGGETGWEISPDVRSPEVGIPTSSYRSKTKSTTYYILLHPFSSQQCALFPLSSITIINHNKMVWSDLKSFGLYINPFIRLTHLYPCRTSIYKDEI